MVRAVGGFNAAFSSCCSSSASSSCAPVRPWSMWIVCDPTTSEHSRLCCRVMRAGDSMRCQTRSSRSADWSRRALETTLARTKRVLKETNHQSRREERTDLHVRWLCVDRLRPDGGCARSIEFLDASRDLSVDGTVSGADMLRSRSRRRELLHAQQGDTTTFRASAAARLCHSCQ